MLVPGDRHDYPDYVNMQSAIKILERDSKFTILPYYPPARAWCIRRSRCPITFLRNVRSEAASSASAADLPNKANYYEAIRRTRRLDKLDDAFFRQIQAVYLGMISYSDWMLGEMLAALERTGHDKDTAFFTFSDHGEWGGDYGLVEKWPSACDDVLNHIPLIARVPGCVPGHVSPEPVELYDVMPTCLELAGIEARHTHFAHSLVPQLRGGAGDPGRATFTEGGYNPYEPQSFEPLSFIISDSAPYAPKVKLQHEHPETVTRATMIQTQDYKLVARPDGQSEFYDRKKDPRELYNVFNDKMYTGQVTELKSRLCDWFIRTGDVVPKEHDARGFPDTSVL